MDIGPLSLLKHQDICSTLNYFTMQSLKELVIAAPKLEVQITLAIVYTILWYFLINRAMVPICISVISKLESKKQFIHFNFESFKKIIKWDIDDDEEQIIVISRIDSAMIQHLVGGILFFPSAFGLGSVLPVGHPTALASHAGLSEMGWEVQDILFRSYEIIYGGDKGRKLNPPALMLPLIAHHSAACMAVIPMNITYPDNTYWHEIFCIIQLGSFVLMFLQQYGYTLNVQTKDGLAKMKIAISISFLTCLWTRVIRYTSLLKILFDTFADDSNWGLIKYGAVPSVLLSLFNIALMTDTWQKFTKFVSMEIKNNSKRNIEKTTRKLDSIKDFASNSSFNHSHIKSLKFYTRSKC